MTVSEQAYVETQSVSTTIASGDAYLTANKFENAVSAYQTAGNQAAAIQSFTIPGSAASTNTTLQALSANLASKSTAQTAQSLAQQILADLNGAIAAAGGVTANQPTTGLTTTQAPSSSGLTIAQVGVIGLVGLGLAGIVYLLWKGPTENSSNDSPGPKRSTKRALIRKGKSVEFLMVEGPAVRCSGAMLHDPSGRYWPRHSVLCGPMPKAQREAMREEVSGQASHYLLKDRFDVSTIDTPPRKLSGWTYLGEVREIRYTRTGRRRPGRYFHPFNKSSALATLVKGRGKARLYRYGRWYRLDLPSSAILDTRGFVWP